VALEVLTAVVIKSSIFGGTMQCSPFIVSRPPFRRNKHVASIFRVEETKQETSMKQVASFDFLLGLFFDDEDGGDMFLRNVS
jgi:hypothetical protein